MNFLSLLATIAPVFLMVAAGGMLRRLRWLTPEGDASLLKMGVHFLLPALIADSILGNAALSNPADCWLPPLLGFALVSGGMGLVALLFAPLKLPAPTRSAGIVCAGMQNYLYLVIPIVEALFDRQALGVLFLHNIGVELAMWTIGVWVLSHGHSGSPWKRIFNIPTLVILVCGLLNFLHANEWIPAFFRKFLHATGQCGVPLALLLTGATLYDQLRTRSEGPSHRAALCVALGARTLLIPVFFLLAARWLPMPTLLRKLIAIQAAMPAAMMPVVLVRHYRADSRFCLQVVLTSTLLGLVTIPLWMRFGLSWVGL